MTATAAPDRLIAPGWLRRLPRVEKVASGPSDTPSFVLSYGLSLVSAVLLLLLVNLTLVSQFQHFTAQHRLYDKLRLTLAEGSIPIGQTDVFGKLVKPGTPMALLTIPELGVKEVVVEGTSSKETKAGVGHRRDTPLPGQPGVSVLMGRSAAYGGVFKHLDRLEKGDEFKVTTGQGVATYRVIGARTGKTQLPVLGPEDGRLTLITASGGAFQPGGVLRVDAELVSKSYPRPAVVLGVGAIPHDEQALAGDRSGLFALSWLLELLVILAVAVVWAWLRWSRLAAWIVFAPVIVVVALAAADRVCSMLPNLI